MPSRIRTIAAVAGTAAAGGAIAFRQARARRTAERFAAAALESLLYAIDANDDDTGRHVRRVATYALILADAAGLSDAERLSVERVALFHDIGKIHEALFDIIHEKSRLTPAERRAIATHPRRGADVLSPLTPFYPDLAEGVLSHHERWDGKGYPRRLRGREIPLTARIVAIADTFDAITHRRPYRAGRPDAAAVRAIREGSGQQFDPELVELMLSAPVMRALAAARRQADRLPRSRPAPGHREAHVPNVNFRWQTRSKAP